MSGSGGECCGLACTCRPCQNDTNNRLISWGKGVYRELGRRLWRGRKRGACSCRGRQRRRGILWLRGVLRRGEQPADGWQARQFREICEGLLEFFEGPLQRELQGRLVCSIAARALEAGSVPKRLR